MNYRRYPQFGWASTIAQWCLELGLDKRNFVDIPCGDGIVAYWIAALLGESCVEAYDVSPQAVSAARRGLGDAQSRVTVGLRSVADVPSGPGNTDIWLLLNSLFLLPDPYGEVVRLRQRFEYLIVVIPDIHARNYALYMQRPSAQRNPHALDPQSLSHKLRELGYAEQRSTYVSPYALYAFDRPGLRWLAPRLLALMDPGAIEAGNYWLGLYRRAGV